MGGCHNRFVDNTTPSYSPSTNYFTLYPAHQLFLALPQSLPHWLIDSH